MNTNSIPTCDDPELLEALSRLIKVQAVRDRLEANVEELERQCEAAREQEQAHTKAVLEAQEQVVRHWRRHVGTLEAVIVGDLIAVGPPAYAWPVDPANDPGHNSLYVRLVPIAAVANG